MATDAGYSPGSTANFVDREGVCYTLTSTGDTVHSGTKRHDDTLPAPGFLVFNAQGMQVDTTADGYTETPCGSCCPQVLGEGCWSNAGGSGRWVSIQQPDGTTALTDIATGDPVAEADVSGCPSEPFVTTVETVTAATRVLADPNLYAWSVRKRSGTVTLATGAGAAVTMDDDETISSEARAGGLLSQDSVTITATGAGDSARLVFTLRG